MTIRCVGVLAALLAGASTTCLAAQVNLSGDLGAGSWTGVTYSPVNAFTTTSFSQAVPGLGSITGDVFSNNSAGASFALRVTNLTYTATIPNPPLGLMDVMIVATHAYQTSGSGPYNSAHQLTGFWTTASGNAVQQDTILDLGNTNFMLPTVSQLNTGNTTSFNVGAAAGSTTTSSIFLIQTTVRLRIDGTGSILLLSSADVQVDFVPAPGGIVLAGMGVLALSRPRR